MKQRMLQTKELKKNANKNQEDNKTHIRKNMLQRRCNKKTPSPKIKLQKKMKALLTPKIITMNRAKN